MLATVFWSVDKLPLAGLERFFFLAILLSLKDQRFEPVPTGSKNFTTNKKLFIHIDLLNRIILYVSFFI